jgi:hypothetical protein
MRFLSWPAVVGAINLCTLIEIKNKNQVLKTEGREPASSCFFFLSKRDCLVKGGTRYGKN